MTGEDRKLTTIMFTDMVGYSALSQQNEALALTLLDEHRQVLRAMFARHGGREIETVGDGFFVEFPSALAGAHCAIDIQQALGRRNATQPLDRQIRVRIGLHLGDVVYRDGHVHGDGVNIAARIEPLAEPGGVCCSEDVARQIQNKIELPVRKLGKGELKNIRLPVDIYRLVLPGERRHLPFSERLTFSFQRKRTRRVALALVAAGLVAIGVITWQVTRPGGPDTRTASDDPVLALPKGPSIAVLPFANLSGDPKQEYFSDGIAEEIITQLTRFGELFVIARNSTFRYKGQSVDIKAVGRELGARYVLEGSVRKAPDRIRVAAQLIDAGSGAHLWAETYDRKLTASNLLGVQDDITERVVGKIAGPSGVISRAGLKETRGKRTDNLTAYECVLHAREYYDASGSAQEQSHLPVRDCLERAIVLDPNYADAWAWLTLIYLDEHRFGYNRRPNPEPLDRALDAARRAAALDPASAMAHYSLAFAYFFRHELERFDAEAEQALALNSHNALLLADLGNLFGYIGQLDQSMALTRKAMALNPHHPTWYYATVFNFHYHRRQYEEALAAAQKWNQPEFYWNQVHLAQAYAQLGRRKEAQAAVTQLLKLYPDFAKKVREEMRIWNNTKEITEHEFDGLRKAGLDIPPE